MADWESLEARAGTLYTELLQTKREEVSAAIAGYDAATVGATALLLIRRIVTEDVPYRVREVAAELGGRRCDVTPADLLLAVAAVTTAPSRRWIDDAMKVLVRIMVRVLESPVTDPDTARAIRALVASLNHHSGLYPSTRSSLRAKLFALLPAAAGTRVDTTPIAGDAWAVAIWPYLDRVTTGAATVTDLIRHLAVATGSKPGKGWLAKAGALLAEPVARDALRFMVDRLADTPTPTDQEYPSVLGHDNEAFARAVVWALLALPEAPPATLVQRIVVRGMAYEYGGWSPIHRVPNAGIFVLGRLATPDAIGALQQLSEKVSNNAYRKAVKAALAEAAAANGLQPGQLIERNISDAGLAADGTVVLAAGDVRARARLGDDLKVTLEWDSGDTVTAKPPADAEKSDVNAVKRQVKEIRDAVGAERRRIEGLLAVGREWTVADWRRYYLDHPLTGRIARQLLWTVTTGTATHTGLPGDGTKLSTLDGEVAVPDTGTVTLWHPATAATDEVAAWRTWLVDNGARQPFKQVYREVYLLTPAEVETDTYSNRFAAHILRYPQLYALFKERGWTSNFLGPYDGGFAGTARRDLTDTGFSVAFEHQQVEAAGGEVEVCGTDRVWFFRTADRGRRPVPLAEVPPLAFSEAMRDVDLFVAVTTIAADPNWVDRGDHPYRDYWTSAASADLTATAQVRREALARLLPRLAVADRLELGDRHLRVRGKLATYKIHIGSASILIEPDDRYLCIVPTRSRSNVMLPFDGDDLLSQILSKALLLAADHRIKDPSITSQLPHRR